MLVLHHLFLDVTQGLSHSVSVNAALKFDDNLTDMHRLHTGYGGLVGPEYTVGKVLSEPTAHLQRGRFYHFVLGMLEIDVHQMVERRVMEQRSLVKQVVGERFEIVVYHLIDNR